MINSAPTVRNPTRTPSYSDIIYMQRAQVRPPTGSWISVSPHEFWSITSVDHVLMACLTPLVPLIFPSPPSQDSVNPTCVSLWDSTYAPISFWMKSLWSLDQDSAKTWSQNTLQAGPAVGQRFLCPQNLLLD